MPMERAPAGLPELPASAETQERLRQAALLLRQAVEFLSAARVTGDRGLFEDLLVRVDALLMAAGGAFSDAAWEAGVLLFREE